MKPYLTPKGEIFFPIDMSDEYKWWKGGKSFDEIVEELVGRYPSGQREQTVNLSPSGFECSTHSLPTI